MDKKLIYLTGGEFNQRKIISYSNKTRPTSQKVRLAVFNMLFKIDGVVLDLFAGSGAYAFEALSRGASFAYINDVDNLSVKAIKENAKNLNVLNRVEITKLDYLKALEYYKEKGIFFDLVFIDPPYDFSDEDLLVIIETLNKTQKKGLRVILERTSSSSLLNVKSLELTSNKKYGNKNVFIYQKM